MTTLVFKDNGGADADFIECCFYDRVDSFCIEISISDNKQVTHSTGDSLYFTIDRAIHHGADLDTFNQYSLDICDVLFGKNPSGNITVVKTIPELTTILTGISLNNVNNLKQFSNHSINRGTFQYDFSNAFSVITKIYITLDGIKYSAVCPEFLYSVVVPTLNDFNIDQTEDSSALKITNLSVNNCNQIKYFPRQINILADVIENANNVNNDKDVLLGNIVLDDNNNYIESSSTMTALDASSNSNTSIANNANVPITQDKYNIPMTIASAGILNKNTNKDVIVYAIGDSKSTVEIPYNSHASKLLRLRAPVRIDNVTTYDAVDNYGRVDRPDMVIMTVKLNTVWTGYEPDIVTFSLKTTNNNIQPDATWRFSTSDKLKYSSDGVYNITLDQMSYDGTNVTDDEAIHKLDNNPSKYELTVTAEWEEIREFRVTKYQDDIIFTQELPPVVNVSAYNTWQPVSQFTSVYIDPNDNVVPRLGITLTILKNDLFNGNTANSLDDPSKTKLRIQYIRRSQLNQESSWTNVPSGYLMQPSGSATADDLLFGGAAASLNGYAVNNSNGSNGLFNVPAVNGTYNDYKLGSHQNPLFVYLANTGNIYHESNSDPLVFRVRVETSVVGYNSSVSEYVSINAPFYSVKKPLVYSWSAGSVLEPYMDFTATPNKMVLPMLVGDSDTSNVQGQSIYYSKGYVNWVQNSALALPLSSPALAVGQYPAFSVDLGVNVTYSVTYEYTNPNVDAGFLLGKPSSEYTAPSQGLPVRSDYTISNNSTNYIYNFLSGKLIFDFSMVPAASSGNPNTSRIDGVEFRIKDANGYVNSGNAIVTFYNHGNNKYTEGVQEIYIDNLGLTRDALYNIEFRPFRDSSVLTADKHLYPADSEWYDQYQFKYLSKSNDPVIYSWLPSLGGREPYMDWVSGKIVIPLFVEQTENYYSATITWLQNDNLGIAYGNATVSVTTREEFPMFPVTLGKKLIYTVIYNYMGPSGTTSSGASSDEYTANCQGMPIASDFTVSNNLVNYVYDNSLDRLVFDLSMIPSAASSGNPNVTRIDGVDLFITGVNSNNVVATFYNYGANMYTEGEQTVSLSNLSGLIRGNSYNMVFKAFRDDRVKSTGQKTYAASLYWYQPPVFTYLRTNVRDSPVLYSWGANNVAAQPYMNFLTNSIVIPMDVEQSPNYVGAIVNWYKNDHLEVDVDKNSGQAPISSAVQYSAVPEFVVDYGTVVIYTVNYVYLSLDGSTRIIGDDSSRRSASCQGMPEIGDFTQSPALDSNGNEVYIQNNSDNTLVFMLDIADTVDTMTHRIDGVVLYVLNDKDQEQYVATFNNSAVDFTDGKCKVNDFTAENYSLTPGKMYTLIFKAYRDIRVLDNSVVFGSDNFIVSDDVKSIVNFVFLNSPMATVYQDQITGSSKVISVSDVITSNYSADNVGGAKDQFTISWPPSKINDVTEYLIYKVTLGVGNEPESRTLEYTQNASAYPYGGMYTYSKDVPDVSQKITYEIQKSYNGRLSDSTRISFPVGKLKTKPATITVMKQSVTHIYSQLLSAELDLIDELLLLDIIVMADDGKGNTPILSFLNNNGKINKNGTDNVLIIPQGYILGQLILLKQVFNIQWYLTVDNDAPQRNLDTYYGTPKSFVYATRPQISLKDETNINGNLVRYNNGNLALKLKLDASMGNGDSELVTPSLTSVITILAQDTSTVTQNNEITGVDNILVFNAAVGQVLEQNRVYNATGDYSNSALPLSLANLADNSITTNFQLHTGDLTNNDTSYLVFPENGGGYVPGSEVNIMILASNNYGVDSYAKTFFF